VITFIAQTDPSAAQPVDLAGAYLFGADQVPLRGDIEQRGGRLTCTKRSQGPAGISLVWDVAPFGRLMLDTTRVTERDRPYILPVELARGRLMRISQKREDWGLFDYPGADDLYAQVDAARNTFVQAMTAANEADAVSIGNNAVRMAAQAGEALSLFHAEVFLDRRKQTGQFGAQLFGAGVSTQDHSEVYKNRLAGATDFISVPITWNTIEAKQGAAVWDRVDPWVTWA
jgi:hypothetical protein